MPSEYTSELTMNRQQKRSTITNQSSFLITTSLSTSHPIDFLKHKKCVDLKQYPFGHGFKPVSLLQPIKYICPLEVFNNPAVYLFYRC